MRIGFDVSPLHRPHPPGVVRATRGLVAALERRARHEIVRFLPPPGVRVGRWRQVELPRAVRASRLDGIHSPVSAFPVLGRGVRVQTIHEVPWANGVDENADARHRWWAAIGPLRADAVVCPSPSTAQLVRAGSPLAADKVHVCAWGVDPVFTDQRQPDDERVLERFGLRDRAFVLAPGAVRAKKNLPGILRGMEHAARPCRLVVTGPLTGRLLADVARAPSVDVRMTGDVDDTTLAVLLRHALAVVVLSVSEGFALPVVEAQASGAPVVVSLGSTQAATANGAALSVDADDGCEIARALERASVDRARLVAAGLWNARRFTWERCAEAVEHVWESCA